MSETDLDKEEKPHLEAFAECVKIEAKVRALIAVRKVFPVLPQSGVSEEEIKNLRERHKNALTAIIDQAIAL